MQTEAQRAVSAVYNAFASGRNTNTRDVYLRDLRDFARFCNKERIDEILEILLAPSTGRTKAVMLVDSYRDHMVRKGLKSGTVGRRMAAIRGVSRTARVLGFIDWTLDES